MDPYLSINVLSRQSRGQEFQHILVELKQTVNSLDDTFLLKIVQALELKSCLSS